MSLNLVFLGDPNEGKTTIIANLMENECAEISALPGTTTKAQCYRLHDSRNRELILATWDTPGFQNSDDMFAWFYEQNDNAIPNLTQLFIESHRDDMSWQHDVELIRPITLGALVVYVVSSHRKPTDSDYKQIQIIRYTGAKRIALINQRDGNGKNWTEDWRELLEREFGTVLTYNPHNSGLDQRLELLDRLANASEQDRQQILNARDTLKSYWEHRIDQLTRKIITKICESVRAAEVDDAEEIAKRKLTDRLISLENEFREEAKKLFNHTRLNIQHPLFDFEIDSTKHWKANKLGMTRKNAAIYGAIVGASGGALVDVLMGGLGFGIPTGIGGIAGASSALAFAYVPYTAKKYGKNQFCVCINPQSQTVNVLLDRMICFSRCILNVSHGIRIEDAIEMATDGECSSVDGWDNEKKNAWAKIVKQMFKPNQSIPDIENNHATDFKLCLNAIKQIFL